jgi:transcriptional regulator with XRE-family HTH domain
MSNTPFPETLSNLRKAAKLTSRELARLAEVPESFISGLQNGRRCIGEVQARKIAKALNLTANDLDAFVIQAIDTCSEKVLHDSQDYPAEVLNLLARQLAQAGILANSILQYKVSGDEHRQDLTILLGTGDTAVLKTHLEYA